MQKYSFDKRFDDREEVLERLRSMSPADIKALISNFLGAADDATKTRIQSVRDLPDEDTFMEKFESKLTDADIVVLNLELFGDGRTTRPRSNSSPFGGRRKSVRRHRRRFGKKTIKRRRHY